MWEYRNGDTGLLLSFHPILDSSLSTLFVVIDLQRLQHTMSVLSDGNHWPWQMTPCIDGFDVSSSQWSYQEPEEPPKAISKRFPRLNVIGPIFGSSVKGWINSRGYHVLLGQISYRKLMKIAKRGVNMSQHPHHKDSLGFLRVSHQGLLDASGKKSQSNLVGKQRNKMK